MLAIATVLKSCSEEVLSHVHPEVSVMSVLSTLYCVLAFWLAIICLVLIRAFHNLIQTSLYSSNCCSYMKMVSTLLLGVYESLRWSFSFDSTNGDSLQVPLHVRTQSLLWLGFEISPTGLCSECWWKPWELRRRGLAEGSRPLASDVGGYVFALFPSLCFLVCHDESSSPHSHHHGLLLHTSPTWWTKPLETMSPIRSPFP